MGEIKKLTRWDIETDLAKLLYYATMCTLAPEHKTIKKNFDEILAIVNTWIKYYSEDLNLKRITDEESIRAHELLEDIPFGMAYNSIYYDRLEIYLDIITYYPECPINEEFDSSTIARRKGMRE